MNNKAIYRQADSKWGSLPFPSGGYTIKGNGCGCCAVTHVIIELDKYKNYTPATIQPYMKQYATKDGLYHSGIPASLKHYGLEVTEIGTSDPMSKAWKLLGSDGRRAGVLLFYGKKGPDGTVWTTSGHFIAFVDYKIVNGKHWFYLKDSSDRTSTHVNINGKRVNERHNGWWCYENSMKGDLPKLWIAKIPGEETKKTTTTTTSSKTYTAIDVSEFQGTIDWTKVKKAGVDAAIIRYADGTYLDPKFATNMKNAIAAGIHVGCYIFSRAKTAAEAESEATRLYNAAKAYKYDMPLYIDLEANNLSKCADTVAAAFLKKMAALGARGGVYANLTWWNNYLTKTAANYSAHPFWIAQYNKTMDHKNPSLFGMWQYSSSGKVDGISSNVDLDHLYVAYWENSLVKNSEKVSETTTATTTLTRSQIISNMESWAKKMAADNRFHYVKWDSAVPGTKKCPICNNASDIYSALANVKEVKKWSKGSEVTAVQKFLNYWMGSGLTVDGDCGDATVKAIKTFQKHYGLTIDGIFGAKSKAKARSVMLGWNCIGFAWAVWHHGGGLKTKCNCGVISNEVGEAIASAKTDAAALKLVQSHLGITDVKVIRNSGKDVAKTNWQAGDICLMFSGNTYKHTFFVMSNSKIADSSSRGGDGSSDISVRNNTNYSARVIIRYTGGAADKTTTTTTTKKAYSGTMPTLKLTKTNAQAISDAIKFAEWIAKDNSFHYGYTSADKSINAHHNGCYFCGTNTTSGGRSKKGIVDYGKTYCCNPFVGACWAHGAGDTTALSLCKKGSSWGYNKKSGYNTSKLFTNLGHPAKSKLQPGDVLCSDTHVALYVGNNKIAEAACGDDNKRNSTSWNDSILITSLTDKRYAKFLRVHRYNGKVSVSSRAICHGEVSDRVRLWQTYLNWYFGKDVVAKDRLFGDGTLTWTKKFQTEQKLTADGIVGPKTLAAAKAVKK